jgi:hypothetical protein
MTAAEVEAAKDIAEEKAVVPLPPSPAKPADDDSKAIVALVVKGTHVIIIPFFLLLLFVWSKLEQDESNK